MNILNFGGGGFVGTAYMVGSLLALDQVLSAPEVCSGVRDGFFDYVDAAGVSFKDLGWRGGDVFAKMPVSVRDGASDVISKYFSVAQGISGGSLLAWSVVGGVPLVHLVKQVLEFDARVYLKLNSRDIVDWIQSLPKTVFEVGLSNGRALYRMMGCPVPRDEVKEFLFNYAGQQLFGLGGIMKRSVPSGLFTSEGLEGFVLEMSKKYGIPVSFSELQKKGKQLIVIADRLDYSRSVTDEGNVYDSEVYFGLHPYDSEPLPRAIRASCSIPLLVKPVRWYDYSLDKYFCLGDGGVSKTIGFKKISSFYPDARLWVVFNPVVPRDSSINNGFDLASQVARKLMYSRKCAVWDWLDEDIKEKTVVFEADKSFPYGVMSWPFMKQGVWHGYWHGLEMILKKYDFITQKLSRAQLSLVPKEIVQKYVGRNEVRKAVYTGLKYSEFSK